MTCQYIKERKYFRFIYYRAMFWIKCVFWPWFQIYFLRRKIVRWKLLPPKIIICNKDQEIRLVIKDNENEDEENSAPAAPERR